MSRDFDPRDYDARPRDDDRVRAFDTRDRGRDQSPSVTDPREVFSRDLDLPRDRDREPVRVRDQEYRLRGSEVRTLATVGAFRVVPADRLRDHDDRPGDPRRSDLRHLRETGLVRTVAVDGRNDVIVLTERGRVLLEDHRRDTGREARPFTDHNRDREGGERDTTQHFYAGLTKPRELAHDASLFDAYVDAADELRREGAHIERVVLDYELKREYQSFLQEHNRDRPDSDGRPDRTREEIEAWAEEHHLPTHDGHVQFPDVRIEYLDELGREHVRDLEVETEHYRGGHAGGKAGTGFTTYRKASGRLGGGGTSRGGAPFDPHHAERVLR